VTPYYEDAAVVIYHGDCRDILASIEADVLITDPDYGVGIDFRKRHGNIHGVGAVGTNGTLRPAAADKLLAEMLGLATVTRNGVVFWSGSWSRIEGLRASVKRAGWRVHHLGIWYKPNGAGPSGNGLARRFEPWFWLERGPKGSRRGEWNALPDCIDVSRVVPGHREALAHPTQKPEELVRRLVRFFSQPGDIILDPFMGSGTTLRAAKDLGRKAIGIDVEEQWCELAANRMRQALLLHDASKNGHLWPTEPDYSDPAVVAAYEDALAVQAEMEAKHHG
jgi:DNA modification methylase